MYAFKKSHISSVRLMMSLAILSVSIVSYEIQLIQFFSIVQWHHYAFMVISIAMLGFGAGGTFLTLFREWLLNRFDVILPFLMISTGLFMTFTVRLSRYDLFLFDSYILFVDRSQISKLLFSYLLFFLPFFTGALAIGLLFVKKVTHIGKYYFSDLIGAGMGGILSIVLFWNFSPQEIPSVISFLPVMAGMILLPKKRNLVLSGYAIISLGVGFYHLKNPFDLSFSPYKGISYALKLPEATIEKEISSPYGLFQVVSSPVIRYAPGLSLTYRNTIPSASFIYHNGNWYSSIQPYSGKDSVHLLDYSTLSLPYRIHKPEDVLIPDTKGGVDVSYAIHNGAKNVIAIEENETTISLLKKYFADVTDSLFFDPVLKIENIESRTFLNKTEDKFDLIQMPLLGSFGGSVGLNALNEENLLTKEAFIEMWSCLKPDGMISISSWMDFPYKIPLKLATTIAESLESSGVGDINDHLAVVRSWNTITFVFKKEILRPHEIENIIAFCDRYEFDLTLLPGLKSGERDVYHTLEDKSFIDSLDRIFGSERERVIAEYDYNIQPATDNKPYFFQFLRWKKLPELIRSVGLSSVPFVELGYLILIVTFIQVVLLALLLIIIPLLSLGWKEGKTAWVFLYFSGLGIGYMFLEIIFIKYFVLYLGHPIYSVATVISVMLLSSGLGSYFSSGFKIDRKILIHITGIIAGLIFIYSLFLGRLLSATVGLEMTGKILITSFTIAIPSFFMGMPFPLGLKMVDTINKSHLPWAWGINGCITVISTSLAVILAVESGFMTVMFFSGLAYFLALMSNFLLRK